MKWFQTRTVLATVVMLGMSSMGWAEDIPPGHAPADELVVPQIGPGDMAPVGAPGLAPPEKIQAPPPGTDLVPPYMQSTTYEHNQAPMEGVIGMHHGRAWMYVDGKHHGYPYYKSAYLPRAAGASYNFGQWIPRRSYYFPYNPGMRQDAPYGYSPEPYYFQSEIPAPVPPSEVDASRGCRLFAWLNGDKPCAHCGCVHGK